MSDLKLKIQTNYHFCAMLPVQMLINLVYRFCGPHVESGILAR